LANTDPRLVDFVNGCNDRISINRTKLTSLLKQPLFENYGDFVQQQSREKIKEIIEGMKEYSMLNRYSSLE